MNIPMRNQKGHVVKITDPNGHSDIVICVSFPMGSFTHYNFYILLQSLDANGLAIPYGREATFQEHLRVMGRAVYFENTQNNLSENIKRIIATAYANNVSIHISEIANDDPAL